MSDKEMIERRIENTEIRKFLHDNLDEIEKDVISFREIIDTTPKEQRPFIMAAGDVFYSGPTLRFVPDIDKLKTKIESAIWHYCCTIDDNTGKPRVEVMNLFDKDGQGTAIIRELIVVAFAAIGGFLAGGVGKLLAKHVAFLIAKILDKIVEGTFIKYCRNIPEN